MKTASICAALLLSGAVVSESFAQAPNPGRASEIRFVKGRLLVQPRAGLKLQDLDRKLGAHGARRVGAIPKIGVHIIELPSRASEVAVARALRSDRQIAFAEPDQVVSPALTPNDASFASAWHLPQIGATLAWDYSQGQGVTIAILDSGVDPAHPDLAASLVAGYNAFDNNTNTADVYGHGTRVAGAAAMTGNNMIGGAGVAFQARIMPIRVTYPDGYGSWSAMANGIIWAADNGARVANLSFQQSCGSATLWNAAQYMRSKGGVVTISAGNSGLLESMSPSDSITCVAATDSADNRTSWSTYGGFVDVAAPGVGIYTTTNGGGFGSVSGTSYSAPITAAVYALMMAANPSLSPDQLDQALFSSALDRGLAGKDGEYGYGRVDAMAAVARARAMTNEDFTAPSVSITSPAANAKVSGAAIVDVDASDNVGVVQVELFAGDTLVGVDTTAPYGFSVDLSGIPDGSLELTAKAVDAAGNTGTASVTVTLGNDSTPPHVAITSPAAGAVVSSPTTINASATDDKQVAKLTLSIDGREVAVSYGSSVSYLWDPYTLSARGKGQLKKSGSGTHSITATATDGSGNAKSTTVSVVVP